MIAGYLLTSYHQLNIEDRYQNWIVAVTLLASFILGLSFGHGIVSATLTTVSWSLYFSLIASDAFHTGMRLRELLGGEESWHEESQKTCKFCRRFVPLIH